MAPPIPIGRRPWLVTRRKGLTMTTECRPAAPFASGEVGLALATVGAEAEAEGMLLGSVGRRKPSEELMARGAVSVASVATLLGRTGDETRVTGAEFESEVPDCEVGEVGGESSEAAAMCMARSVSASSLLCCMRRLTELVVLEELAGLGGPAAAGIPSNGGVPCGDRRGAPLLPLLACGEMRGCAPSSSSDSERSSMLRSTSSSSPGDSIGSASAMRRRARSAAILGL